jgi:hypothetical protein
MATQSTGGDLPQRLLQALAAYAANNSSSASNAAA